MFTLGEESRSLIDNEKCGEYGDAFFVDDHVGDEEKKSECSSIYGLTQMPVFVFVFI